MACNLDLEFMQLALAEAEKAAGANEVPVGAVVIINGVVVGRGHNKPISSCDMTAHAEIEALRHAAQVCGNYRLPNSTLYVTIEPCSMCVGAIVHARVERLVFGAYEPKAGVVVSQDEGFAKPYWNHRVEVEGGVCAEQCSALIKEFFAQRRAAKKAIKSNSQGLDHC